MPTRFPRSGRSRPGPCTSLSYHILHRTSPPSRCCQPVDIKALSSEVGTPVRVRKTCQNKRLEYDEFRLMRRSNGSEPALLLAGRVGVGALPQDALVEVIGCPPPAALWRASALPSASTSPASRRGEADRRQNRFNQKPSRFRKSRTFRPGFGGSASLGSASLGSASLGSVSLGLARRSI